MAETSVGTRRKSERMRQGGRPAIHDIEGRMERRGKYVKSVFGYPPRERERSSLLCANMFRGMPHDGLNCTRKRKGKADVNS